MFPRLIAISTILSLLISGTSLAQDFVTKPEGDVVRISSEEIRKHEKQGAYYNEFWNYHISLDNGAQIYLNYSMSHFGGFRGAVSGARMSILNWEGKDYKAAREYDIEKLIFEEDSFKMNLNPERGIWFEGKLPDHHKVHFKTDKNGTHFDINIDFKEILPGFTWGDGLFNLGEHDEMGMYTHIPGAKVDGFIALDFDTVKVTGTAFMDHIYQTNVGTRLFEKSFRYVRADEKSYIAGDFLIPKDAEDEVAGYAFEVKDGLVSLKKPSSITTLRKGKFLGEEVSSVIEICFENEECDTIEVVDMQEKIAMLDELGGIKKMLAKRFLGGDIIELRGSALLNKKKVFYNLTVLD
jgi:hypothetical protein